MKLTNDNFTEILLDVPNDIILFEFFKIFESEILKSSSYLFLIIKNMF